jgi:hypothetical protein
LAWCSTKTGADDKFVVRFDRRVLIDGQGIIGAMEPSDLNDEVNWTGGFYELAFELGPTDDSRLEQALLAVWREASVVGCFAAVTHQPALHIPAPLTLDSLVANGHLRGVVRLPDGRDIVCGAVAVRFENAADWLSFYFPLGALARTDPAIGGYPFSADSGDASLIWRRPIDDWLAGVATRVFDEVPFLLGVVGMEALDEVDAADLADGIPEQRQDGVLIPISGVLTYLPANQ